MTPTDKTTTSEFVRENLLEQGFHAVGFAPADRATDADRFEAWLRRGYAADMEYMARDVERRLDPTAVLPGARSVIVVARFYRQGNRPVLREMEGNDRGEISCYAWGTDYHRLIEKRLRAACRVFAEQFSGERFRYNVDTGPVLERSWAAAAGLGWIGKNTCAIDPRRGSYFFIGSILTTLSLTPDAPATDHCGNCTRCIDACPTAAIVEPNRLDARLCISYQNIENRGAIPEDLRSAHGNLIFGCDICQEVCPFNLAHARRVEAGACAATPIEPEFDARPENRAPRLTEFASLESDGAFREHFPRSAVRRATFTGFIRNVIIAIGNSGKKEWIALLDQISQRPHARDPVIAATLEWARARLEEA